MPSYDGNWAALGGLYHAIGRPSVWPLSSQAAGNLVGFANQANGPNNVAVSVITELQTGPQTLAPYGHCVVGLYNQTTLQLVRQGISDAGGHRTFPYIDATAAYFAVAFDPAGIYDMVATRNLQLSP